MSKDFMKEALKALKQSFKDSDIWYEGPGYIGTPYLVIGGEQAEIDFMKMQANLHTKPKNKRNILQEAVDSVIKKAQNDNSDIMEEPGLIYVDKNGKTLRVLLGDSIGVVFVNDKYIPNGNVSDALATAPNVPLYVVPRGKIGLSDPHWMIVAPYQVDEKFTKHFEALAREIVKQH